MDETEYPLLAHLKDLRRSLWRASIGVALAMILCLFWAEELLILLRKPMGDMLGHKSRFVVLSPHEYFFTQMKVALSAGILIASPWIMVQVWLFIAPGLYKREKRLMLAFVCASVFFFLSGVYFAYAVVFPSMFRFFLQGLPSDIAGTYSIGMLFGFATHFLLAFGFVFETPLIVFLLVLMGVLEVRDLAKARGYVVVMAFIVAAIVTPTPDPLTQTLMAVPMILLYELGILASRFWTRRFRVKPMA